MSQLYIPISDNFKPSDVEDVEFITPNQASDLHIVEISFKTTSDVSKLYLLVRFNRKLTEEEKQGLSVEQRILNDFVINDDI